MNKIISIILIILVLVLVTATIYLYSKNQHLDSALSGAQELLNKAQKEVTLLRSEKEELVKEKNKFHADAISYVAANTKLEKEKEKLADAIEKAQETINLKESELQRAKQKLQEFEKKLSSQTPGARSKTQKTVNSLKEKIQELEETLKGERALYHYNLGVSYAQAKLYNEAIQAYEKALEFNPDIAEAYYNLGILYENILYEEEAALKNYQRYLELKPQAEDAQEVQSWIKRLNKGVGSEEKILFD